MKPVIIGLLSCACIAAAVHHSPAGESLPPTSRWVDIERPIEYKILEEMRETNRLLRSIDCVLRYKFGPPSSSCRDGIPSEQPK